MDEESKKGFFIKTGCKVLSSVEIMTILEKEAPANLVPAAAVIREGLALIKMIWLKEFVGCFFFLLVKYLVYHLFMRVIILH